MATRRSNDSRNTPQSGTPAGVGEVATTEPGAAEPAAKRAPRRRSAAPKKTAAEKPLAAEPVRVEVPTEARHAMIAEAAYLRAERRGFSPGYELEDWLAAESEIDALLSAGGGPAQ